MKHFLILSLILVAGCSTFRSSDYRPRTSKEKKAFPKADKHVQPSAVQEHFERYRYTEIAWAGIIEDIQFKETDRTIQVAFEVDHRGFDWMEHSGGRPYQLLDQGDGLFTVGWVVQKPARISYLKTLAKPGYMILVYGKPYRMVDGVIQIKASAVRPISSGDFSIIPIPTGLEIFADPEVATEPPE